MQLRQWHDGRRTQPARTPATPASLLDAGVDYLRAAQAYMLISMPTAISTISGFFQAMRSSRFAGLMPQWV
ncbi:hypothetical protein Rpal_2157 [Rhodopseudomonas palustris TIE-1]|nr:hypothetical protein Rpal_2157 [Rhodopseudomonas palustris TIE-1]